MRVAPDHKPKTGRSIAGVVRLQPADKLDDAVLIVALHDVTYLDAPSRIVAERRYGAISALHGEMQFCLGLPSDLPSDARFVLKAEIRRSDPNLLSSGDYISTAAHPWTPGEAQATILVRRI